MIKRTIGILGGMGPEATILLQQRVMSALPAAKDDGDHIPLLIDMNPQVPSRIDYLINGHGANPAPVLAQMAKRLEKAGASALAMPCNTAHHFSDAIHNAVDIPFIDMVSLSAKTASQHSKPGDKIGILASPAVRMTGIFERALGALDRITIWPEPDDHMLRAISLIKKDGAKQETANIVKKASEDLAAQGSKVQLLACSEFSLLSATLQRANCHIIDTLDVLTQAVIETSMVV
ncbi:MAG: amino acid racemase [Paracoccaceae bacterium]|nr:amino acid racemase [Paracoccaceae bacterium]